MQEQTGSLVLVIDDDDALRQSVREVLELSGHTVILAADGSDGLQILTTRGDEFDLVLLDLTMPVMSGEETLKEIRKTHPDLPVVLMSGYTEEEIANRLADLSVSSILPKPFRLDTLEDAVTRALE